MRSKPADLSAIVVTMAALLGACATPINSDPVAERGPSGGSASGGAGMSGGGPGSGNGGSVAGGSAGVGPGPDSGGASGVGGGSGASGSDGAGGSSTVGGAVGASGAGAGGGSGAGGNGGNGGVAGGPGASGASGAGAGGSGTSGSGGSAGAGGHQAPFAVDALFIPAGYMGDGSASIVMTPNVSDMDRTCGGDRASASAVGDCHRVTYSGATWGGVYWQYPENNWGASPGITIAAGATQVSFYAKGASGGEVITFVAGGISGASYQDGFRVSADVTLTDTWHRYSLAIAGQPYSRVLGGFAWSAAAVGNPAPLVFQIDDIRWE